MNSKNKGEWNPTNIPGPDALLTLSKSSMGRNVSPIHKFGTIFPSRVLILRDTTNFLSSRISAGMENISLLLQVIFATMDSATSIFITPNYTDLTEQACRLTRLEINAAIEILNGVRMGAISYLLFRISVWGQAASPSFTIFPMEASGAMLATSQSHCPQSQIHASILYPS